MTESPSENMAGATPLSPEELDDLIPVTITTQAELNEWEQINIQDADIWAFSRKHSNLISSTFICRLHERMFGNVWKWAGSFRKSDKNIGIQWTDIRTELKMLCDDCTFWLEHQTYSIDEIAARFHHRLVLIHPFPNGNGRHARMIADLVLYGAGEDRFSWGGDMSQKSDDDMRNKYLQCLRMADEGDYSPLMDFVRS